MVIVCTSVNPADGNTASIMGLETKLDVAGANSKFAIATGLDDPAYRK